MPAHPHSTRLRASIWCPLLLSLGLCNQGCMTLLAAGLGASDDTLRSTMEVDLAFIEAGVSSAIARQSSQCACSHQQRTDAEWTCCDPHDPNCDVECCHHEHGARLYENDHAHTCCSTD